MRYAYIEYSLRGAYPDLNGAWYAIKTRRELKALLTDLANGEASQRDITSHAACMWREWDKAGLAMVLPCRDGFGLHVCPGSRYEYLTNRE
jgi:hypothetical protein